MDSPTNKRGEPFLFQTIWIYISSLNLLPEIQSNAYRKRIKHNNFGFAVMLSGNCQAGPHLYPGIHSPNMEPPDNYQTTYDSRDDSKTKIVVFYFSKYMALTVDD